MLEPIHVIALGLTVSLAGVLWQFYQSAPMSAAQITQVSTPTVAPLPTSSIMKGPEPEMGAPEGKRVFTAQEKEDIRNALAEMEKALDTSGARAGGILNNLHLKMIPHSAQYGFSDQAILEKLSELQTVLQNLRTAIWTEIPNKYGHKDELLALVGRTDVPGAFGRAVLATRQDFDRMQEYLSGVQKPGLDAEVRRSLARHVRPRGDSQLAADFGNWRSACIARIRERRDTL
jgi:hypothetical protein